MTSRRLSVAFSVWLLLLASCSQPPRMDEFEAAIGRLTQDDLTRRFGYPQRLKRLPTGTEVWDYEFLAGGSRCVGYRVYFDDAHRSTRWEPRACAAAP
jgi:hypothetical protein